MSKSIITVHVSKDIDPKTLEALGQMMLKAEEMVMSKETYPRKVGKTKATENAQTAWDKFEELTKVIVNTPKEKKRKTKKKPTKKPKKKGGN